MTSKEQVTDFKLEGTSIRQLLQAVNAHLSLCGIEPEDRGFGVNHELEDYRNPNTAKIPNARDYRWLIAFAIEGSNEGYYIHIGAMMHFPTRGFGSFEIPDTPVGKIHITPRPATMTYMDFGHAKCYSAEQAYQIATEAQRFLTAAAWN